MKETTLCYLEQDGRYLMLYRNVKRGDPNKGKWIGLGGKLEKGETPEQCVCREVKEECGVTLTEYAYRGVVHFQSDLHEDEKMHLFTATAWEGEFHECDEGQLRWVPKGDVSGLPLWEGDIVFFRALERNEAFFELTLTYQHNRLINTQLRF